MLQGIEAEIGEIGRLGVTKDAEDTTFVVEVVVGDGLRPHPFCLRPCNQALSCTTCRFAAKGAVRTSSPKIPNAGLLSPCGSKPTWLTKVATRMNVRVIAHARFLASPYAKPNRVERTKNKRPSTAPSRNP